ncbi:MAG: S1 RNA-binding domain-containing protein [Pleurocapsa minor GSE-CHR-MK-17-07R]|nr:S1 RNA-binding domain-containing protein [Pleurocapsa minor GSE-CHR-MK 17-07R]
MPSDDATAAPASVPAPAESTSESAPSPTENTATPAPVPAGPPSDAASDLPFGRGELVTATIVETSPTSIKLDLGGKAVGTIKGSELDRMSPRDLEDLKTGSTVTVYFLGSRDKEGQYIVSVNQAAEAQDWQRAEEYRVSQEPYDTRIAGYNRGGLIVKFGRLRGFVPQSQMNAERRRTSEEQTPDERWSGMVNEAIVVKVMEVDHERNRLILSERMASKESREKRKESLISQLQVGEERVGRVVSLEDFGAFVDVGGAEGLVHLTELSWQHVNHPREMLKVGEEVKVRVISIDPNAKRIGLSMKQLASDPWDIVATTYVNGQLVKATVTKLTKFGAFAQITDLPEIEGLIHISELSERRVLHPREVVNEGDVLTLRIVKMDVKERRLGLSLKRVNSSEYMDIDWGDTPSE